MGRTARHNLARVRQLRRVLGIPNPITHYNLCREISQGWNDIVSHISKSNLTVTDPILDPAQERAIVARIQPQDRLATIANKRSVGRYAVLADVLQCFPSIYTHTLPWALHTKEVAKAHKTDLALLGNRLDYWVRQGQDQQTLGIPIGPDTSLVLAEILLASIDERITTVCVPLAGYRAVDDYELIFADRSSAENALANIQGILDEFELKLNEKNSKIIELPVCLDYLWPVRLRRFEIRSGIRTQRADLLDFFSLAFDLSQQNPFSSVLRYALSRSNNLSILPTSWDTYQDLLLQCANAEPGTLSHVTAELSKYKSLGLKVDTDRVQSLVTQLIKRHLQLGQGSEVAWALWMAISLKITMSHEVTAILPSTNDALVPVLSLYAQSKNLLSGTLDLSRWSSLMTTEDLWTENWLLSYESNVEGWLPSVGSTDHVDQDPCFRFLKNNRVKFFNGRASSLVVKRWRPLFSPIGTAQGSY